MFKINLFWMSLRSMTYVDLRVTSTGVLWVLLGAIKRVIR